MGLELLKENIDLRSFNNSWAKHECLWSIPPSILNIASNEVHVWSISLDMPSILIHAMEQTLSSDERLKANKFHFEKHRRRYIATHGSLRKILCKYLCTDPS